MNKKRIEIYNQDNAEHSVLLWNYADQHSIPDIIEYIDINSPRLKLNDREYLFENIETGGTTVILYIDIEYEGVRKEIEKILIDFFSGDLHNHFTMKCRVPGEYQNKCILFGKHIWQYNQ